MNVTEAGNLSKAPYTLHLMDNCSNFLVIDHELLSKTFTTAVTTQQRNMMAPCEGLEGLNDLKNSTIK
jgi:hypothetical protein